MPALLLQIINYISLAIKFAPQAKELYDEGEKIVQSWFEAGLITAAQQNLYMSWADAHQAAVLAGEVPPEFKVE